MNKTELIEKIASDINLSKVEVGMVVDAFLIGISEAIKDEDVVLRGFGAFRKVGQKKVIDTPVLPVKMKYNRPNILFEASRRIMD